MFTSSVVAGAIGVSSASGRSAAQGATPVAGEGLQSALDALPAMIDEMQQTTGVPGLAVAVVHNDQVIYAQGFGEREVGTGAAVGPDTVFQIASLSKPVSSTVVSSVVGNTDIDWNSRVSRLFPEFALSDSWVTANVTLADLFSHRSGLPDHVGDDLEDLGGTREQVLESLQFVELEGKFRDSYAYTNFGLTAAAEAVARSQGAEWEALGDELLFAPASMTQTSFRHSDFVSRPDRALGHVLQDGTWVQAFDRQPDAQSPAGGVSSSVNDLARWMRLQLRNGELDGTRLVDEAALGTTHLPHARTGLTNGSYGVLPGFYGLGWNVGYDATKTVVLSHSGAFAYGAATAVYLWPGDDLGIVVLTNGAPVGLPESICLSFHDTYHLGAPAMDYLTLIGGYMETELQPQYGAGVLEAPANPEPPLALDHYVGNYGNDVYGALEIAESGDGLVMTLGPDNMEFQLTHFNRDVFTYEPIGENAGRDSAVTFTVAADGTASQVVVENLDVYHAGTFTRIQADTPAT